MRGRSRGYGSRRGVARAGYGRRRMRHAATARGAPSTCGRPDTTKYNIHINTQYTDTEPIAEFRILSYYIYQANTRVFFYTERSRTFSTFQSERTPHSLTMFVPAGSLT